MTALTGPMADLMWDVAQHKYGWAHVSRFGGQLQVADALVRRGLVEWGVNGRDHQHPRVCSTASRDALIKERWPVSPYVLGTYEPQPGGWAPVSAATAMSPKRGSDA